MRYLLDTNVVLYLLGNRLADPLPGGTYSISVITELELLGYPGISAQEEQRIQSFLGKLAIVELVTPVKQQTIRLRRSHRLRLPDAIVAATAHHLPATLLTNDRDLLAVTEITTQSLRLK